MVFSVGTAARGGFTLAWRSSRNAWETGLTGDCGSVLLLVVGGCVMSHPKTQWLEVTNTINSDPVDSVCFLGF